MDLLSFQEALEELCNEHDLPSTIRTTFTKRGEVIIHTGLVVDTNDELVDLRGEEDEEEGEFFGNDDFETLIDDEEPEDE